MASYPNRQLFQHYNATWPTSHLSLSIKLHPALTWHWAARLFSLQPTQSRGRLNVPSMGTAALSGITTAAALPPIRSKDGGGWSCLVCTGCQRSRSLIGMTLGGGWTVWKYSSGIHWRTTATTIQGESLVSPTLLSLNTVILPAQTFWVWSLMTSTCF